MRRSALLFATIAVLGACASTKSTRVATPQKKQEPALLGETSGAFIALSVADIDRVLPWYRDVLGFEVFSEGTAPDRPVRFALLVQGNAFIEILQIPDAKPRKEAAPSAPEAHQIHGFFKSGFVVQNIDALYETLKHANVPFAYALGQPAGGPYRSFGVRDPEGNLLQIFGK